MYLPKTIVLDQFPEGMELHNFLEKVKHSTLTDTWPQIRRTLLDSRVPAIVESLRARLESAEVGLVNKVDLRAEEIRRASTKITDLPWDFEPLKQIKGIDALAREYLYMKHSSAVNGRNKGISKSALKRQFGFTLSECANIHFEHLCPSCGQMAEGSVDSLAEDIVKQYGFLTINCKHCGHSEEISAPNYYSDDHFTCKCEKCTFAAREAAQFVAEQLRGIGVKLAHSVTVEVKRVCDELQQIQSRRDSNADVSQESKIVASHLWQRPNDHLVDAIEVVRKRTRNSLRHYEFMVDAWNILVNLLKDGLVDVQMHAVDLSDQQMVLECLLCESRMLFRTSEKEKQKALVKASADMTRFLRGPILNKPTGMHEWLKAVNDLGLTRNWFELPVDFHWTLNTARLAEIAGVR